MNLHYKKEFAELLRTGRKKHTIRKKGVLEDTQLKHIIYPYHHDKRECVLENKCTGIQDFEIIHSQYSGDKGYDKGIWVKVDNILLSDFWIRELAFNDGFKDEIKFYQYFKEDFKGVIIHWTKLRYNI